MYYELIYDRLIRKKFSDADNQAVVAKLLLEVKGQDDTITNKQIKGTHNMYWLKYPLYLQWISLNWTPVNRTFRK